MKRVPVLYGLCCLCCLAWPGCMSFRMAREADVPEGDSNLRAEEAYQLLLEQHTAEKTLLDGLNTRAVVAATLQQPAFVRARVERTGSLRAWPEDKTQAEWAQERWRLEGLTEFFVGLQTASSRHNELDTRASIWQLSLRVGDAVYFPSALHRVGRSTLDMRGLYPYMGLAWVAYVVQFPVSLTPPFRATLVVSSTLGRAELFYVETAEGMTARSH